MLGILATFLRHRETIIDSLNKSLPANVLWVGDYRILPSPMNTFGAMANLEKSPKDKTRRLFGWFVPGWPF